VVGAVEARLVEAEREDSESCAWYKDRPVFWRECDGEIRYHGRRLLRGATVTRGDWKANARRLGSR
jgi:hypothetical protein